MRSFIIGLALCLSACGGYDGVSQVQVEQDIAKAPNQATGVSALQAQVASLNKQMSNVQIIGQLKKPGTEDFRKMGEPIVESVSQATPFGACPNMGIFQGRGGSDSSNPVGSQFEIYKTEGCADSSLDGQITSYSNITGQHDTAPYLAWDDSTCGQNGGTLYIETDEPSNFYAAALTGGVFSVGGQSYWIKPGQTPEPIMIQSAINTRPGGGFCGIDQEVRMVVIAIRNDFNQSGIPDSLVAGSWEQVAP